ncbi:Guanosine-diphosphatase [Spathaspora sp. JA1]|nr:Guanosine-diphosphatase [Spathaspora sp. JA1]
MLNTRNLRVTLITLGLVGIIVFFASSSNTFGNSIQKIKPAAQYELENVKNTIAGLKQNIDPPVPETQDVGLEDIVKPIPEDLASKEGLPKAEQVPSSDNDIVKPKKQPVSKTPESSKSTAKKVDKKKKPAKANDPNCKDVEYVIMIDAGSTGSRVHVYEFNTCTQPPKLINEVFEMLKPGLSSFDTDTVGAAKSLDPLLKTALEKIPADKHSCTPIAVKATAGLRLLGETKSNAILAEVRRHLEQDFPFAVVADDGVAIMDGRDEGVYAWITANFLLGNIGNEEKAPTAAVFDLGGGSTQVVFEPQNGESLPEGEQKYKFTFGEDEFTLYQFSHLGYGLMQGRNKINSLVLKSKLDDLTLTKYTRSTAKEAKANTEITNPCIPPGAIAKDVIVEISEDEVYVVNMKGPKDATLGTTPGTQCRAFAEQVLNKDAKCETKPCSFNGVHQPSLTRGFARSSDMYVFSYFYDRTQPIGFPQSFTVEELRDLSRVVCNGDSQWNDVFLGDHVKELQKEPQWCLDLSFITAMLHTGYDIPLDRELKTAQTIDGNELGWCLGAALPLLDKTNSKWTCRVDNISL